MEVGTSERKYFLRNASPALKVLQMSSPLGKVVTAVVCPVVSLSNSSKLKDLAEQWQYMKGNCHERCTPTRCCVLCISVVYWMKGPLNVSFN